MTRDNESVSTTAGEDLIGRDELVRRLLDARRLTLVSGVAGIGKSSVVRAVAESAAANGAAVGWGTCVEGGSVPGYWPWTQALEDLVHTVGADTAQEAAGEDASILAALLPAFGGNTANVTTDRDRLVLWDATARLLESLAAGQPVVVVIDDLQWADASSLALLDFLASTPRRQALHLVGAFRDDDVPTEMQPQFARIVVHAEHVAVPPLDRDGVTTLVRRMAASAVDDAVIERIFRRAGGHPFFTRELALLAGTGDADEIPVAVRGAISQRLAQVAGRTHDVLEVAAVMGTPLRRDVLATVTGIGAAGVEQAIVEASRAGILLGGPDPRFTHDLYREAILDATPPDTRLQRHHELAAELERRAERSTGIAPAEVASHATAAMALDGSERAGRWALAAAAHDAGSLAFTEAAAHLRRWRTAVAETGADTDDELLLDVLLDEAHALGTKGDTVDARSLLRLARDIATRCGSATHLARAALCTAQLGGKFATRRDEVIAELDAARHAVASVDPSLEARVTATLARELQHSVADDRPDAEPLSERALELGRRAGDAPTLLDCLLARHDVLWTPGAAEQREPVTREIIDVARRCRDQERLAEGLLLLANSLLEQGSAAFLPPLEECLAVLDRLGQPRHRYLAETRRAALALLHGDLEVADAAIQTAVAIGERIREPDTSNVEMSQRLELVRARGEPDELRAFAELAVAHWSGAPVHAHAVAAGFQARSGDLDAARRHLATVLDLGGWQADRSYLWSVFVRELAAAAIALEERAVCDALLGDLLPVAGTCGVNGAVVAFAGSHAHTAGLLAASLDRDDAPTLLEQARRAYERLGARCWLVGLDPFPPRLGPGAAPVMRRRNGMWDLHFGTERATVPHSKGLADIAELISRAGHDVHVLELVDAPLGATRADAVADRRALQAYRRRLAELDDDQANAADRHDIEHVARIDAERDALLTQLRQATGLAGQSRSFANHPAERARKAVAARIRDAIRKLDRDMPTLAAHLDGAIITGTYCRYRTE